mgnify:FL=1
MLKLFDIKKFPSKVTGLNEELKTEYIIELYKKFGSVLVVTDTLYEANNFFQSISKHEECLFFPMDDFLTSEAIAVSPELKVTRLETMNELVKNNNRIVVTNMMGYLRYLPTPDLYKKSDLKIKLGDTIDIHKLVNKLYDLGYTRESVVNKTGEIAVRGFVVDIFPINYKKPIRIEFWGDTVDSIRYFNIDSQMSLDNIKEINVFSYTEFLSTKSAPFEYRLQKNLKDYTDVVGIVDYLKNKNVVFDDYERFNDSYLNLVNEMMEYSISNDISASFKYMNDIKDFKLDNILDINSLSGEKYISSNIVPFNGIDDINKRLNEYVKKDYIIIVYINNINKINKLINDLENENALITDENNLVSGKINFVIGDIKNGFIYKNYVVISETEIFNSKDNYQYKTNFKMGSKIRDINKLNVGDYVVHSSYGIGTYMGIKTIVKNGIKKDYLQINYQDDDKLYVPASKMEFITKYSSGDGVKPKINKLGSNEWNKAKAKARKHIEEMTKELLELYAKREKAVGFQFLDNKELQDEFDNDFAYTETSDQIKVEEEISKDMESVHPMDRLLCGDVGYGKTEVAFRAMFKAVCSSKQVALLCPTTILSSQHYKNAVERFKDFDVRICLINRFVSKRIMDANIEKIRRGEIDIVIGTHRILSNDIVFKDLGLLVIDEEQRFGVRHKEKIKAYKNNIDVLTLSATPIPRTLQMSMTGLRSLSLIETPPVNRYPVQTYVLKENKTIIKDAIYKELSRGGQIFILYNYVETIEEKMLEIKKLIPELKIVHAHGRMSKVELEDVMQKFINKEYDCLICTTIIETGIDIPNVNTLIIMDADRFGLSQLYQIRGRVGRSNKVAYCYLMYKPEKNLNETAVKRLKAIKEFTELGSGFSIAMRDLSLRGAGSILGSEQAGFVDDIGIELFMKMLNEEIDRLNGKEKVEVKEMPLLDAPSSVGDDLAIESDMKLLIHKKINSIDSLESLEKVKQELTDRFGKLDDDVIIYMYSEWFEKLANNIVDKIKVNRNSVDVIFNKDITNKIDGRELFMEVNKLSRMFRFSMKDNSLVITLDTIKLDKHYIYYLIDLVKLVKKSIK